jgi:D-tyrosyl-tRNA(Tyr) deacylase
VRVLFQRVVHAAVRVRGAIVGGIGQGALLLAGIGRGDDEAALRWMARKVGALRAFPDAAGKMNLSLLEIGGGVLVVPQFTLYGDCRKGNRPSFAAAEEPARAAILHREFLQALRAEGLPRVESGEFGASMQVELVNDGPVTLWLESPAGPER